MIYPVILSGGAGTRLWPLSRELYPKQLLPLVSENSLLQDTARRATGADFAAPLIVCNDEHRFIIAEQLRQMAIKPRAIVLEPAARNTAPAVAAAAILLLRDDPNALMLVLPSDHTIGDEAAFGRAVAAAAAAARSGRLVTFGITPIQPETGYGYICRGPALAGVTGAFLIERFVEKPDLATAKTYLADGTWSWNSGMFLFPARLFLDELVKFEPAMADAAQRSVKSAHTDLDFVRLEAEAFKSSPSNSIDYAVMERTKQAAMVPADLGWSDIGAWSALWEIGARDETGNVALGDVIALDTKNSYLRSGDGTLLATFGIENMVIVVTRDVVMAVSKDRAQDVKKIVEEVKRRGRGEATSHTLVHRPWGSYQTVDSGPRFQVKRIIVKPSAKISLQKHARRAEHWVVVSGTARVTRDEDTLVLRENMSAYIPLGAVHRLENIGTDPLHIIEVQSGGYLGEDDIVRLEDSYGRK
jgi:mannose-1-phosphate guanylyltransferase/mannose-1-phosphate guanylyltransferase/mannose-6-phosphate isomerase